MMVIEKLNSKNQKDLLLLMDEAKKKSPFRLEYLGYYNNQSFLVKYFVKKLVKIIKCDGKYIGYFWTDVPTNKSTKVSDLFIKEEYIHLFNEKLPYIFKSNLVLYEGFEDAYTKYLIRILKFTKIRITNMMSINLNNINFEGYKSFSKFKEFEEGKDEALRTRVQNEIFKEDNRVPLKVEDIKYDIKQEYYLKHSSIFIYKESKVVGYGQIIYNRNVYLIVNFGILPIYRREGLGKELLYKLMEIAKSKGIGELYIRVDNNNIPAKRLYESCGFSQVGNFSSWIWSKELIN